MELSPTTKEIKKKHLSRLVGGAETGSQGAQVSRHGRARGWSRRVAAGGVGSPTIMC